MAVLVTGAALLLFGRYLGSTADEIIAGYKDHPQTEDEIPWADQATVQMIAYEPW